MTASPPSPIHPPPAPVLPDQLVAPIVDYEPAPLAAVAQACPPPTPKAMHRSTTRPLRPVQLAARRHAEPPAPRAAAVFAEHTLRRVLEAADRRRAIAALHPLLTQPLIDTVLALSRTPSTEGAAVLRRVRVRTADTVDGEATAAEVFGTYTRGPRVRAVAGRIEVVDGRWRLVALQLG